MTLRLMTIGVERVTSTRTQEVFKTIDLHLPEDLKLNDRAIIGYEVLNDEPEMVMAPEDGTAIAVPNEEEPPKPPVQTADGPDSFF